MQRTTQSHLHWGMGQESRAGTSASQTFVPAATGSGPNRCSHTPHRASPLLKIGTGEQLPISSGEDLSLAGAGGSMFRGLLPESPLGTSSGSDRFWSSISVPEIPACFAKEEQRLVGTCPCQSPGTCLRRPHPLLWLF